MSETFKLPSVGWIGNKPVDRQVMDKVNKKALMMKRATRRKRRVSCAQNKQLKLWEKNNGK